jgi:hypothetical protein
MPNSGANPSVAYLDNPTRTPDGDAMSPNKIAATAEWNEAPISH